MQQNTINQIESWFKTAVPNPTQTNINVQVGCHLEEFTEMLSAADLTNPMLIDNLTYQANLLKNNDVDIIIDNPVDVLDALCDQIVTAIGVAHMFGMDIQGALQEVANSNDSKFEDGKPVFNEHGKIAKGKNYFKPELAKFIKKDLEND